MNQDTARMRNESIRWLIMETLYNARSIGALEQIIVAVIETVHPDATQDELRHEYEYLQRHELITLEVRTNGSRHCKSTPYGMNYVAGTEPLRLGIARPSNKNNRPGRPPINKAVTG